MVNEVLTASSFGEVKSNIDATLLSLQKQNVSGDNILSFLDSTLKEFKSLNQSRLPYDQYANIITAKVHLKELQLRMFNVIN